MRDNKWLDFWSNNKNISFQNRLTYLLIAVNNGDKQAKELFNIIDNSKDYISWR